MEYKELPEVLKDFIKQSDVLVFEGFDMVGKSHLLSQVYEELEYHTNKGTFKYRPDWEGCLSTNVVSRGNRYIPGIVLLDIWKSVIKSTYSQPKLLIDRWLAVSYVYSVLYDQKSDSKSSQDLIKAHVDAVGDLELTFIYKCHKDKNEAWRLYELANADSDHEDEYDKFDNFDRYYETYQLAHSLYMDFFRNLDKFKVVVISSLDNEILEVING